LNKDLALKARSEADEDHLSTLSDLVYFEGARSLIGGKLEGLFFSDQLGAVEKRRNDKSPTRKTKNLQLKRRSVIKKKGKLP